eukprot:3455669-Alexandrium_andersonii.AAC.1
MAPQPPAAPVEATMDPTGRAALQAALDESAQEAYGPAPNALDGPPARQVFVVRDGRAVARRAAAGLPKPGPEPPASPALGAAQPLQVGPLPAAPPVVSTDPPLPPPGLRAWPRPAGPRAGPLP